jgi:hypothetical protein
MLLINGLLSNKEAPTRVAMLGAVGSNNALSNCILAYSLRLTNTWNTDFMIMS